MADVVLTIQSSAYAGWQQVSVRRGMEQISGEFDISLTERWPGSLVDWRIQPGDACTLALDHQTVITGWVDSHEIRYDAQQHQVRVTGRDKTGDLVDCSAITQSKDAKFNSRFAAQKGQAVKGGEWRDITIQQLADELCQPFGIDVKVVESGASIGNLAIANTKLKGIAIQEGETVFEILERAARMAGVLLMADGEGRLIITRADTKGAPIATLELGRNILTGAWNLDFRDRFSEYLIKGQRRGSDDDAEDAKAITQGSASASDQAVRRYRPLVLLAEDLGEGVTLQRRIDWERNVRAGKSIRATYTVNGWRPGQDQPLWDINRLVTVRDTWVGVDVDLLIVGLEYTLDDSGMMTALELTLPEALEILPEAEKLEKRPGQKQKKAKTQQFKGKGKQSDQDGSPAEGSFQFPSNLDEWRYK